MGKVVLRFFTFGQSSRCVVSNPTGMNLVSGYLVDVCITVIELMGRKKVKEMEGARVYYVFFS